MITLLSIEIIAGFIATIIIGLFLAYVAESLSANIGHEVTWKELDNYLKYVIHTNSLFMVISGILLVHLQITCILTTIIYIFLRWA